VNPRRVLTPQHVPLQAAMMAPSVTLLHAAGDGTLWDDDGWEASGFSCPLAALCETEGSGRFRAGARISLPASVLPGPAVRQPGTSHADPVGCACTGQV